MVVYVAGNESQTFGKMEFNTLVNKYTDYGSMGNRLGQNVCIDCGIISVFYHDPDRHFTGQSPFLPESINLHLLCLNN